MRNVDIWNLLFAVVVFGLIILRTEGRSDHRTGAGGTMPSFKIDKSTFAIWLSVLSFGLSGWEYYNSQREARITSSVDLSIRNLYGDLAYLRNGKEALDAGQDDQEVLNRVNAWFFFLDYVASLINAGKLDESYIAPVLKCEMRDHYAQAYSKEPANEAQKKAFPSKAQMYDLMKFATEHQGMNC